MWFPIVGASLAIDLANTTYYAHGERHEGLATAGDLTQWFAMIGDRLGFDPPSANRALLAETQALRGAIRAVFDAVHERQIPARASVRQVNRAARAAAVWPTLRTIDGALASVRSTDHRRQAALAVVAHDAIAVVTGPDRDRLRSCSGPGCPGYLLQTDPRQHFCSTRCANRSRAARSYHRQG